MRDKSGILLSLLLSFPLLSPALAQEDMTGAGDFFDESPLILTASRMSKPLLETPASVSVIDRQMIEASGVRDIADLFRLVPGFVVGYHSGHAPVVTYHGLGEEFGRQIQVLIDGRSVFIPSFGGVPWSNLPLLIEDIQRIEVIRGPNAVTYGANAFLATINIITRHAAEDLGNRVSVTASDNANPDIADAYLRLGRHHEAVDWRLSLGAISDDGFDAINDSREVGKLNFRADIASGNNHFWTLQTGTSNSRLGRGFPRTSESQTDIERTERATNSYLNLQWEGVRESGSSIVRLTHTRQDVTDHYDPGPLTIDGIAGITTFIDFDRTSERSELELVQNSEVSDRLRLVYGGSLRRDRVKSLFLLNQDDFRDVDTGRLFGSVEWRFDDEWLLDMGVMYEDTSLTSREASPRISLIRKFGNRHALRLVQSTARRNPILWEFDGETEFVAEVPVFGTVVLPTFQGNNDLQPEDIESREIGLRSRLDSGIVTDIKIFSLRIENHIVAGEINVDLGPPLGVQQVDTTINGETTDVDGIEFELGYKPDSRFRLNTGFSLVDADSTLAELENSFPDYTAFVAAQYRINRRHEISGAYYYLDDIDWPDGDYIPIARRLDLRYAYHLEKDFKFEVVGQNLLEDFEDYEPENLHRQLFYLRLSGSF
ncbi:MAG: TonB-dependent receptor [Gammaproteobacteria bacterium]